jgi:Protein of unknown function (DUF3667)
MNAPADAGGTLAQAQVPAAVLDPAAAARAAPPLRRCDNCGAQVPQRYCGVCGQQADSPVHSLREFARHAAEDLTHADSRVWRTLSALLRRPGFLTTEFLHGRRARYLPPLRLYLMLSVVFFLCAGIRQDPGILQLDLASASAPAARAGRAPDADSVLRRLPGETPQQTAVRVCGTFDYHGPLQARVALGWQRVCPQVVEDGGRTLAAAYVHNLPRAMFLFLPLLAALMMLLYWRPRHYYVEHLLLLIHNHACVFLAVVLEWLLSALLPAASTALLGPALFFYLVWYCYRSMRVVYGQGSWRTAAKFAVLGLSYLVVGALMVALDMLYSALTL